jgi:cysteine-rich repeat protein
MKLPVLVENATLWRPTVDVTSASPYESLTHSEAGMRHRTIVPVLLLTAILAAGVPLLAQETDPDGDGRVGESTGPADVPPCPPGGFGADSDRIVAVSYDFSDSPVSVIDPVTGSGSQIGLSGFDELNSLARSDTGELYSVQDGAPFALVTIDENVGAGSFVTTVSLGSVTPRIRALAFAPNGDLLAVNNEGSGTGQDDLYAIDVATGVGTLIGPTTFDGVQALAFSPGGTLYAWDIFEGLLTVDPATGLATDVGPAGADAQLQSIDFDPSGKLYGSLDELYEIDAATGEICLIGSGGYEDVRGIAYLGLCGNGELDPGEECDDGNNVSGDGCAADCTIEQDVPATSTPGLLAIGLILTAWSWSVLRARRTETGP